MKVLETESTVVRLLTEDDAEFMFELMNEPSWIRYIGDRGIASVDDARQYIREKIIASYERFGFGLFMVERRSDGVPMGINGLIKRDELEDVDIGFAFLPQFWGQGYARESALAVLEYGLKQFDLKRIVAITVAENESSIKLLERLGLRFEKTVQLSGEGEETQLFGRDL